MSWRYNQSNGCLIYGGELVAHGHSGHGVHQNRPESEAIVNEGPIPRGRYEISRQFQSETYGPVCMHLSPMPGTDTHGRGGFLVRGASTDATGCLILPRLIRLLIDASDDRELEVV